MRQIMGYIPARTSPDHTDECIAAGHVVTSGGAPTTTIIAGDLNAVPHFEEITTALNEGFRCMHQQAHRTKAPCDYVTWDSHNPIASGGFQKGGHDLALDYLLLRGPADVVSTSVVARKDQAGCMSDHYALLGSVMLPLSHQ